MVLKYLAVAALAAGGTYAAMPRASDTPPRSLVQACTFSDSEGNVLEVGDGPFGPRLGDLDYIARNLSHEEKVRVLASESFDTAGLVERMASDLIRSSDRVARDVYRSIERSFREGF